MPNTPKLALPYPVPADPADVPTDMGKLATRVDTVAGAASGLATLGADGKVPAAQLPAQAPSSIISSALGAGVHRLQAGQVLGVMTSGQYALTFPVAFSNPNVFVIVTNLNTGSNQVGRVVSANASGCVIAWGGGGTGDNAHFNWVAVGLA